MISLIDERLRLQMVEAIRIVLNQWRSGYDWQWFVGPPPNASEIGLDDIDTRNMTSPESDPIRKSIGAIWWFVDAFLYSASHGFEDMNGIPWDEAVRILEESKARLENNQAIEDQRVLAYPSVYQSRGLKDFFRTLFGLSSKP